MRIQRSTWLAWDAGFRIVKWEKTGLEHVGYFFNNNLLIVDILISNPILHRSPYSKINGSNTFVGCDQNIWVLSRDNRYFVTLPFNVLQQIIFMNIAFQQNIRVDISLNHFDVVYSDSGFFFVYLQDYVETRRSSEYKLPFLFWNRMQIFWFNETIFELVFIDSHWFFRIFQPQYGSFMHVLHR